MVGETLLIVPRGRTGLDPLRLDMAVIYQAENRLREVAIANQVTAPELMATYNGAANQIGKYISWAKYEKLSGEKELRLAKAEVIIDQMPAEAKRLKADGIKMNEDFREAMIARNTKCSDLQERLIMIEAVLALLESKFWSFIRAYDAVQHVSSLKGASVVDRMNATPGMLSDQNVTGFMGKPNY